MLVLGIIAGVAAPRYRSALAEYRSEAAAQRIVADLHFARSEALRTSQSRMVQFESANGRYTLVNVADLDREASSFVVNLVDDPFWASFVSVAFGGDENVVFDRFGRPDSVGTVVVQSSNVQRTVTLAADGNATVN